MPTACSSGRLVPFGLIMAPGGASSFLVFSVGNEIHNPNANQEVALFDLARHPYLAGKLRVFQSFLKVFTLSVLKRNVKYIFIAAILKMGLSMK